MLHEVKWPAQNQILQLKVVAVGLKTVASDTDSWALFTVRRRNINVSKDSGYIGLFIESLKENVWLYVR